jgi:hypothetical protein
MPGPAPRDNRLLLTESGRLLCGPALTLRVRPAWIRTTVRLTITDPPPVASSPGGNMNEFLNREEMPLPDYGHIPLGTPGR